MNITLKSQTDYKIFLNSLYIKNLNIKSKDAIIDYVKNFLMKKKQFLNLKGFYKVIVYVKEKIGLFLDIIKIEDSSFFNNLDLRIIINLDCEVYYETEDFFLIKNEKNIFYKSEYYYCPVDENFTFDYKRLEFGRFIFGNEITNLLKDINIL